MLLTVSSFSQQTNYKITQSVSMPGMQGQSMTNTTWVRGPRKRTQSGGMMGMGGDVANIEQCDLKQYVQVNDKKKLYHIDPMDDGTPASRSPVGGGIKSAPAQKGGVVTYVSNITDTGERKPMYGMTARHLKTSMSMEASPDACMKGSMKSESDGWYIDLPEWSCPIRMQPTNYGGGAHGGCQDRIAFRNTGSGKLGFALEETRTMSMGEGQSFTQTTSTLEFTKAPLEASLFDVPTGYTLVSDTSALYGQPDMSAMMAAMKNGGNTGDDESNNNRTSSRSDNMKAAMPAFTGIKIAVLIPTSRGEGVSGSALQSYLVDKLTGGNVMGIAVSSEAEARSMGAAYILTSDISKLKQSTGGKIGGMFGKVTGVPTGGSPYDAQVDYKLVKLADGSTVLSSKAASKSESEAQRAAEVILGQEAAAVLGSVK